MGLKYGRKGGEGTHMKDYKTSRKERHENTKQITFSEKMFML
jgi:hypothetical protein